MTTTMHLNVLDSEDSERARLARELMALIHGEVRFGRHDRMLYATDASNYQVEPIGVVIPRSIDDALRVINYARDRKISLLPRGGGTSLAGQCVNHAIVIDFSVHCGQLLEFDEADRTCRVEPGIVLDDLNREIGARCNNRLWFGPDVATSNRANLGGMIGNNSAGAHSILYGRTVRHVRALRIALADGTVLDLHRNAAAEDDRVHQLTRQVAETLRPIAAQIRDRFPKISRTEGCYNLDRIVEQLERSSSGTFDEVNLAHLLVGSEGTLAVTLDATLGLVSRPKSKGLAVTGFTSLDEAMEAVPRIIETGPSAVELLDDVVVDLARHNIEYRRYLDLMPKPNEGRLDAILYIEYFGDNQDEVVSKMESLASLLPDAPVERHTTARDMERVWKLRKAAEPLVHAIPGSRKPVGFVEDTAVDPTKLPEFVRRFREIVEKHGTRASYYAHASVGCLHIRPLLDLREAVDRQAMDGIARDVADLVREFRGSYSAEHGFGRARAALLDRLFTPEIVAAIRDIKRIFDPENRLNPGIFDDPQKITEHLRIQPDDQLIRFQPTETFFDYEDEGGFDHAIERCNGAGVCRKINTGTMCPSYMATLDERHSTRGRGNALRLAMTGQLDPTGQSFGHAQWDDPQTLETLDLCLSCKGCKSECPTNVDMAKYKAEYLAQTFRQRGRPPLAAYMLGHIHLWNRLASIMPGIANALGSFPPLRAIANKSLGLAPKRSLPKFARPFHDWMRRYSQPIDDDAPGLVLYVDCFTAYNEPEIGRATVRVMNAFGYRVYAPMNSCCGRAMISQGLLPQAQHTIGRAIYELKNAIDSYQPEAVLMCEPSCLASVRDDWLSIKVHAPNELRQNLADVSRLPEEFLEERWEKHPIRPSPVAGFRRPPSRLALHGHCHQKALWGLDSTMNLLRRLANDEKTRIEALDTGCCGMAGAFGYKADHYDLSMKIGELVLFPAVRELQADDVILAPGTSCRHQIHDGTQRRALHPMQWIAGRLGLSDE